VRAATTAEGAGASFAAAAGAAGSLIDRLFRSPGVLHGGVINWVHLWFYGPTFNRLTSGRGVAYCSRRPAGCRGIDPGY
jgi:hypothetical protein